MERAGEPGFKGEYQLRHGGGRTFSHESSSQHHFGREAPDVNSKNAVPLLAVCTRLPSARLDATDGRFHAGANSEFGDSQTR